MTSVARFFLENFLFPGRKHFCTKKNLIFEEVPTFLKEKSESFVGVSTCFFFFEKLFISGKKTFLYEKNLILTKVPTFLKETLEPFVSASTCFFFLIFYFRKENIFVPKKTWFLQKYQGKVPRKHRSPFFFNYFLFPGRKHF